MTFSPSLLSAISALYVKNDFTADDKKVLIEIFENVKLALKASIRDNFWMSATTKKAALEKAEKVVRRLGYPEYLDQKGDSFVVVFFSFVVVIVVVAVIINVVKMKYSYYSL